jgi:hypothetical protein
MLNKQLCKAKRKIVAVLSVLRISVLVGGAFQSDKIVQRVL